MWSNILIIYLKEIKEVLRDRRTLIFMIVMPLILVPMLFNFLISFVAKSEVKAQTEVLAFAVFGDEYLPELAQAYTDSNDFKRIEITDFNDMESSINQNIIKFALSIPEKAQEQIENGKQATIHIYYNDASVNSRVRYRAGDVIRQVSDKLRSVHLITLGFESPEEQDNLVFPLKIEDHGIAEEREKLGAQVGGFLPYLFIIFCMMGSMYPAIDLGAGEKERGTLETLLLAPIKRQQIVLGKFLVVFTTGVTSALLSLVGMSVMLMTKGKDVTGELGQIIASISVIDLILIASMLIPTAAMFAALLLSVSIYARSFKEASSYCGPLNFLAIVPAIIAMLPIVSLDWYWAMVPVTNVSLAIKELIKGTMNYEMLIAILGSSIVIAGALLFFCTKWFERESVLFRE